MSTDPMKLKSWPAFFKAIKSGEKMHDIRSMRDRTFFVGQRLIMQEYDPFMGRYSGSEVEVEVTYITSNDTPCAYSSAVLERGYCVLSIKLVTDAVMHLSAEDRLAIARNHENIGHLAILNPIGVH